MGSLKIKPETLQQGKQKKIWQPCQICLYNWAHATAIGAEKEATANYVLKKQGKPEKMHSEELNEQRIACTLTMLNITRTMLTPMEVVAIPALIVSDLLFLLLLYVLIWIADFTRKI